MTAAAVPRTTAWADAANALAARVASLAMADADGSPVWVGDDLDPAQLAAGVEEPGVVTARLDEGLLTGRAGIALVLATCARLPGGDPRWANLARRAASAAVRGAFGSLPGGPLGWDSGALGVARAAGAVADLTGDRVLRTASERLGLAAVEAVRAGEGLPPWSDLLGGVAGVLLGVAQAPLPAEAEEARLAAIPALIDVLARASVEDAAGVRWPMATTDQPVAGLAHGSSGIALALRLGAKALVGRPRPHPPRLVSSDDAVFAAARARQLAAGALRWEAGQIDVATGGWPDLRTPSRAPGLAWCHGAPGIGICAATLAALEPRTRAAEVAHATFLRAVRAAALHRPNGQPFDGTLCHGLGGVVELHLTAATAWPEAAAEHVRSARRVADHLVRAGEPGHPAWTCGVRGGRTPNVLVGISGVALTLARCHDPRIAPGVLG